MSKILRWTFGGMLITWMVAVTFVAALLLIRTQLQTKEPVIPQPTPTQTPWVLVVTATPFQPSPATPTPVVVQPAAPEEWTLYESEGGVPYNGTTLSLDVAPDEIEIVTAGPACIAGVCLPGGVDRGSVIILLPSSEVVIHYEVTGLIPGSNWHGSYRPVQNPADEATWRTLANDRITAMQQAPNCTPGTGCVIVDVLIVGPSGVIAQWVVNK